MRYLLFLIPLGLFAQNFTNVQSPTTLSSDPGTCAPGNWYFNSTTPVFRGCLTTNSWSNLGSGQPGGTSGQIQVNSSGVFGGITLAGDCTFSSPNISCTKTGGTPFGAMATLTATAASDLSGTWPNITVAKVSGVAFSSSNIASAPVIRDASGNFAGGTFTGNVTGNVSGSAATITGQLVAGNLTVLTTSGDILYRNGASLARLPIVPDGTCLGANAGVWTNLSCSVGGGSGFNGINAQTISYTLVSGDNGKLVTENGASLTSTLPAAPPSATWTAGLENLNASTLTVARNGLTINGAAANISLLQYQTAYLFTDNSNYFLLNRPLSAGTGISLTESATSEQIGINSAITQTNAIDQSGACQYLVSTTGTSAYTASLATGCAALLGPYKAGMRFLLNADTTCASPCTLNIDFIGIVTIKQKDGVTNANGTPVAGQAVWIWYDGAVFRLMY
jgi:hypothetical protein